MESREFLHYLANSEVNFFPLGTIPRHRLSVGKREKPAPRWGRFRSMNSRIHSPDELYIRRLEVFVASAVWVRKETGFNLASESNFPACGLFHNLRGMVDRRSYSASIQAEDAGWKQVAVKELSPPGWERRRPGVYSELQGEGFTTSKEIFSPYRLINC